MLGNIAGQDFEFLASGIEKCSLWLVPLLFYVCHVVILMDTIINEPKYYHTTTKICILETCSGVLKVLYETKGIVMHTTPNRVSKIG